MPKFQRHDLVLKLSNKMFGHFLRSYDLSFVPINPFQQEGWLGKKKYEKMNILKTKSSFAKKYKAFSFLKNTFPLFWLDYTALKVSGITFEFNCTTNICNFYFLSVFLCQMQYGKRLLYLNIEFIRQLI